MPQDSAEPSFVDGRLHSFRYYFCSVCANAGLPERILMTWLGHRNSKMLQHYNNLHDKESQKHTARSGLGSYRC
uniref:tyrosine-type recombinase/integrase n=1 Tax=Thalassoglobus polymorphus TaxID=2527994 RepID=UPI0011A9E067